jgi:putative ABC transport system permease protein
MRRQQLLLRLMLKAAWVRKDRALTALLSIAVVAAMATVAMTIYSDLEGKFSREFRSFGANAVAMARSGSVSEDEVAKIRKILGEKSEVAPLRYAVVTGASDRRIVVGGTDLRAFHQLNPSWSFNVDSRNVYGKFINTYPWMGSRVAQTLVPGAVNYDLRYGAKSITIPLGLTFKAGSEDDNRIYISFEDFERLTGLKPDHVQLRIDGPPAAVERQIAELSASLPQLEFKALRQVTVAQTAVLNKTRAVVLAASAVVVVLIVLCMVATLSGTVLERRRDFAVMKALGASNGIVNLLFAGEAALTSVVGAIVGFIAGTAIAFWIGKANFGAAIMPRPELLVPVVLGSIVLTLTASTAPLNLLRRIQPAGILRGE